MGSPLYHPAFMKYRDIPAESAGRHTVGNVHRSPIRYQVIEPFVNLILRFRIQGSRGLIQQHKGRSLVHGSCQRDLLGLSARHLHPVIVKIPVKNG